MNVKLKVHDENYDVVEMDFPGRFDVCPDCGGTGTQVNPAIDGNGISSEQFADDPDFEEAYFSGAYDIRCQNCGGNRVVPVVNVSACSYAQKRILVREREIEREEAIMRAEHAAEVRFGC